MSKIRKIYLYIFSLVGLVLVVIGCVELVNLGLKAYVFTAADQYYSYPMPAPVAVNKGTSTLPVETPSRSDIETYNKEQLAANRQSAAANALAMIIVGLPLYLYHWNAVRKDKEEDWDRA